MTITTTPAVPAVPSTNSARDARDTTGWWRQPYCWLVISGPLVVVIAAFITLFIAYERADGVEPEYVMAHRASGRPMSLQPAEEARNHAASPKPAEN